MLTSPGSSGLEVKTWWRFSRSYLTTTCWGTGLIKCQAILVTSPPVLETVSQSRRTTTPPSSHRNCSRRADSGQSCIIVLFSFYCKRIKIFRNTDNQTTFPELKFWGQTQSSSSPTVVEGLFSTGTKPLHSNGHKMLFSTSTVFSVNVCPNASQVLE